MSTKNIRLQDLKGENVLHPETDDSLVLNKKFLQSDTSQNIFEIGDEQANIILQIDDKGNLKTKEFDSTNVYTKDKVYNKEETYSKQETYTKNEVNSKIDNEITTQVLNKKAQANGFATLDDGGKVPSSQLPSYVDDVLEYSTKSAFPQVGESGKIYVTLDTNLTYRWGGSDYVEISKSLALGETSSTAYQGDKGKANKEAIDNLTSIVGNIKDGTNIDSFKDVEDALNTKVDNTRVEETFDATSNNLPTSKAIATYIESQGTSGVQSIGVGDGILKSGSEANPTLSLDKGIDSLTNYYKKDELNNKLENKLDKVTTQDVLYGTNSNGEQTTYNIDDINKIQDVKVDNESVVENKVANIKSVIKTKDSNVSLEVCDENNNTLLEIDNQGNIRTKSFDSSKNISTSEIVLDY